MRNHNPESKNSMSGSKTSHRSSFAPSDNRRYGAIAALGISAPMMSYAGMPWPGYLNYFHKDGLIRRISDPAPALRGAIMMPAAAGGKPPASR